MVPRADADHPALHRCCRAAPGDRHREAEDPPRLPRRAWPGRYGMTGRPRTDVTGVRPVTTKPLAFIYDRHNTPASGVLLKRLQTCRGYAAERGWPVAGEWVDTGHVALSTNRPQFDILVSKLLGAHQLGDRPVVCLVTEWGRL